MKKMPYRFSICGKREIEQFARQRLTHLLSLEDPQTPKETPSWFHGEHLQLWFHDVESTDEARLFQAAAPTRAQVAEILSFGERCLEASRSGPVHALVHCFAGISRSTAASFVLAAQAFGASQAEAALRLVQAARPEAFPNRLIIQYADHLLGRDGELVRVLQPLRSAYGSMVEEWAKASGAATEE